MHFIYFAWLFRVLEHQNRNKPILYKLLATSLLDIEAKFLDRKNVQSQLGLKAMTTELKSLALSQQLYPCHLTNLQYTVSGTQVAQLVDHLTCKPQVVTSSPALGK